MQITPKLGKALKIFRVEKDLSQGDIGEALGVSQQTIGDWEKTGNVPVKRWDKVKEFYGIDPADYQDGKIEIGNIGRDNMTVSGRDMINNKASERLSPYEQTLIKLLRAKDPTEEYILKIISELAAK